MVLSNEQIRYLRNLLEQQMNDIADEILAELPLETPE